MRRTFICFPLHSGEGKNGVFQLFHTLGYHNVVQANLCIPPGSYYHTGTAEKGKE